MASNAAVSDLMCSQRAGLRFAGSTYSTTSTRRPAGEYSCRPVSRKE